MFLEEDGKIFVIENNRVIASMDKTSYYGTCPRPDCEEYGATKYDIKKNENCSGCGTSMKVEFPAKSKSKKTDAEEKGLGENKEAASGGVYDQENDPEGMPIMPEEEGLSDPNMGARMDTQQQVDQWRQQQFQGMGLDPGLHDTRDSVNPEQPRVDLHQLQDLINRGATPEQALSILSKVANPNLLPNMAPQSNPCPTCGAAVPAGGVCPTCTANMGTAPGALPPQPPMTYGARVSHREEEGTIISMVPGMYGTTYGVKFDNGKISEFLEDQLTAVATEAPIYESNFEEFEASYNTYDPMPANTLDELERKEVVARSIHSKARSMILDPKLSMQERFSIDNIITSTSADLRDFESSKFHLQEQEESAYLARAPKYEIGKEFMGWGSRTKVKSNEDISWVDMVDGDFEPISTERLVNMAMESVSNVSRENLQNDFFMNEVEKYAINGLPSEVTSRFSNIFKEARKLKLAEPEEKKEIKEPETFDDVDDSAIFM